LADIEQVIIEAIKTALRDTHTALPARVISFNSTNQTVNVQPTIKRVFRDGDIADLPVISEVRIAFQNVGNFCITFPLSSGDEGLLIFAERNIGAWQQSGKNEIPNDTRMHDLSDAIFFPMCYSDPNKISSFSASDISIRTRDGSGKIEIAPDGRIEIERSGNKVLQTMSDLLGTLSTETVTILGIPYTLDHQSEYAGYKTVIDNIKK